MMVSYHFEQMGNSGVARATVISVIRESLSGVSE